MVAWSLRTNAAGSDKSPAVSHSCVLFALRSLNFAIGQHEPALGFMSTPTWIADADRATTVR